MTYSRYDFLSSSSHLSIQITQNQINAGIVKGLATGIATTAPKAFVLVISNPVNSTVPIVAEVFKKFGVFDPKRWTPMILISQYLI
jgi:hypothetical protein